MRAKCGNCKIGTRYIDDVECGDYHPDTGHIYTVKSELCTYCDYCEALEPEDESLITH